MPPPLYRFVHVHIHEFEHQGQTAGGLVAGGVSGRGLLEHFVERDDVRVRRQSFQGLDLAKVVHLHAWLRVPVNAGRPTYLVDVLKVSLHALYGCVFPGLDGLRLEHLGESALALLADEPVLCAAVSSQFLLCILSSMKNYYIINSNFEALNINSKLFGNNHSNRPGETGG